MSSCILRFVAPRLCLFVCLLFLNKHHEFVLIRILFQNENVGL